jgi:hypothetical protein
MKPQRRPTVFSAREQNDHSVVIFCDEIAALHFREESRHCQLDQRGRLYDWRDDLRALAMRRFIRPWTDEDEERLKALVGQGASIVRASAALRRRKVVVRERAKKLGCRFPTLAAARKKWAGGPNNEWRD